jgi:hypothetical protein
MKRLAFPLVLLTVTALGARPGAQYSGRTAGRYPPEWESDQFRVRRIAVPPGAQMTEAGEADSVIVFLTANLEGRMPPAEAAWLPAAPSTLENRGPARFEAIVIEVKGASAPPGRATPPEAIPSSDRADLWRLIDNPRVLVTKLRYAPVTSPDAMHFHPHDTLVIYLNGGYTRSATEQSSDWYPWPIARWLPTERVARGDVDVIPANTFHSFSNAGFDPLEFLAIFVK